MSRLCTHIDLVTLTYISRSSYFVIFFVKVFMSLYLLNMLMDQVDSLHVGRYWSEVLCCTITARLSDLEVKVIDFNRFSDKAQVRRATLSCFTSTYCAYQCCSGEDGQRDTQGELDNFEKLGSNSPPQD